MEKNSVKKKHILAKPFMKWAGGKTQLLGALEKRLPSIIMDSMFIERYVEPFVGAGAMFFFLKNNYQVKKSFLLDANSELIKAYQVLQKDHQELIELLRILEDEHLGKSEKSRKENYYTIRELYNQQIRHLDYESNNDNWIQRTALLIFLNKTCFNGLYRLNSKGEFNVPFGRYKNPSICDEGNLRLVHQSLKNTELINADFTQARKFIEKETLVYLDPPYRPISRTSHFTSYSRDGFTDEDQKKLANFYGDMDHLGAYLMLSNSDPKNQDPGDEFFDKLYKNYKIERVTAKRSINSNTSLRGDIKEIIVRNY
jgi:DNA adenine methylase